VANIAPSFIAIKSSYIIDKESKEEIVMKNILKFKNDKVEKSKEDVKMKTPKNLKKIVIGVGAGLGLLVGGAAWLANKGKTESDKDDIYDDEYDVEDEDTTVVALTESEEV